MPCVRLTAAASVRTREPRTFLAHSSLASVRSDFRVLLRFMFAVTANSTTADKWYVVVRCTSTTFHLARQQDWPVLWNHCEVCTMLFVPVLTEAWCFWSNQFTVYTSRVSPTGEQSICHSLWQYFFLVFLVLVWCEQHSAVIIANNAPVFKVCIYICSSRSIKLQMILSFCHFKFHSHYNSF